MSKLNLIYQRLRSNADPSVDVAMAAALPTADALTLRLLGLTLLERRHPDGILALIRWFHRLPHDAQEAVLRHAHELYHGLRIASEAREGEGPSNVVEIIRRSRSFRLTYLLTDVLRYGTTDLRAGAAACLLVLATGLHEEAKQFGAPRDLISEHALQSTLEEALTLYAHHQQPAVLQAIAAMSPRAMPGVIRILQDRSNPAVEPMRKVIESTSSPEIRRSLLMWIRLPSLADSAITRLQITPLPELADVLESAHQLTLASVSRALHRLPSPEALCPAGDAVAQIPTPIRAALPKWFAALPLSTPKQIALIAPLVNDPDRPTRLAALRELIQLAATSDSTAANEAIVPFCNDSNASHARIALRHLIRCHWPGIARLLLQLMNSQHEEVRRLAGGHLAPLGFAKFWDAWPRLSFAQQLAGGQALIKIDPNFHRLLGERLARPERAARLRAMALVYTLNQGELFELPLVALTRDPDEVVAASAVRALGSANSPAVVEALEKSLRHADSRVRANAIESLQQIQSSRHVNRLVEMAHGDDSRPRANAIHALMEMRTEEAIGALVNMLADNRPAQRISALWLVDHLGLVEVARHVAELSISDPDRQVKGRAGNVIQHLIQSLEPHGPPAPELEEHAHGEKHA